MKIRSHSSPELEISVHPFSVFTRSSVLLAVGIVLAACGGGGGGGATAPLPTPVASATPGVSGSTAAAAASGGATAAPAASGGATSTAGGVGSCGLNGSAGIQDEILQRINALRAKGATCGTKVYGPTTPVTWNAALFSAALGHSQDMATQNYFDHTSLDGRAFYTRVKNAGYNYSSTAENIAAGQTTVQEVMDAWTTSSGHCANMLNPVYKEVAVACASNSKSAYELYWTMDLGSK